MDDAYRTQMAAAESAESSGLAELMALKEGDAFLVADHWGDLKGGADGLFAGDTRMLSRWIMTVGLARPSKLSSGVSQDNVFFSCHTTNRPLPPMGGRSAPAGVLHIERRRFLWKRRMFERVRMVNHGVEDVLLRSRISDGLPSSVLDAEGRTAIAGLIADELIDGRHAIAGRIVLTRRGRLLADAVVRRLLP